MAASSADNPIDLGSTDEDEPSAVPPPKRPKLQSSSPPLHLVCTSDTHGHHDRVAVPAPPSDESCLVLCGDFDSGSKIEAWLQKAPQVLYKYKIIVCGNHDDTHKKLDPHADAAFQPADYNSCLRESIAMQERAGVKKSSVVRSAVMLHNTGVIIGGRLLFGSPYHTHDPQNDSRNNRNFERAEEELAAMFATIPSETEVLITHAGPHKILDRESKGRHLGSKALLERVHQLPKLKLHVFGHVHASTSAEDAAACGLTVQHRQPSLLQKCGSDGTHPVPGDVRVVADGRGCAFANAAGLRIGAGQMRFQEGAALAPLRQGSLREPLVFKLDETDGARIVE